MRIETAQRILSQHLGLTMSSGSPEFLAGTRGVRFNKDFPQDIVLEGVFTARELAALAAMMEFYGRGEES